MSLSTKETGKNSSDPIAVATTAFSAIGKFAKKGAAFISASADAVGLTDTVHAAEKAARKVAARGRVDASKAVNKAKRMASRVLDFEDDDADTADFDLLLSNVGAIEKYIPIHSIHQQTFDLPAGSALVWKARVKRLEIGFSVKELRRDGDVEIETPRKYGCSTQIQGHITATSYQRTICLTFDNTNSLKVKTIVYWVAIGENVSLYDDAINSARTKEFVAAEEGPLE